MWHYLFVGSIAEARALSDQLQEAYFLLRVATGNMDAAIFSRYDPEMIGTHFYFSPGTEPLAAAHHAARCEMPARSEAGVVLIGDQAVILRILPEG